MRRFLIGLAKLSIRNKRQMDLKLADCCRNRYCWPNELPRTEQQVLKFIWIERVTGSKCKWIDVMHSVLTCLILDSAGSIHQNTRQKQDSFVCTVINQHCYGCNISCSTASFKFISVGRNSYHLTQKRCSACSKSEKIFFSLNPWKRYYSLWRSDANFYALPPTNWNINKKRFGIGCSQ